MLHAESTAVEMIRSAGAGRVLTLVPDVLPSPAAVSDELRLLIAEPSYDPDAIDRSVYETLSARTSTRVLAEALDLACNRASDAR
jgi:hypothetical protein